MAVSNLDMHALFVLGDLRAKLVKLFQSRFVYITEQNAEGIYVAEIDTESALVVDDKPGLKLKVGDHFSAAVLPSREGGKFEIRFRDIKQTIYGLGDYAFVPFVRTGLAAAIRSAPTANRATVRAAVEMR